MKKPKRPRDPNQLAKHIVGIAVGDAPRDYDLATASESIEARRKGGLKGGKARARSLSSKRRRAIAKKAAKARWGR